MRISIIALLLMIPFNPFAQNYILPGGEYMDTTSASATNCKDRDLYYYIVGGKYLKSSSTLLKEAKAFLQSKPAVNSQSGYITFRFMIGCEGKKMKKTEVLQTDEQYIPSHFNKDLVNDLYAFLLTMNDWKTAKAKNGETYPYRAFITFKLKDGKVINIIP